MRAELLFACAGMTLATYLTRALFTVSVSRVKMTPFWARALSFVPLVVLTALVTPYLFLPEGSGGVSVFNPYMTAGIATLILSFRTRNLLLSAVMGTTLFLALIRFFPH